jgi:hypothetical protein
MLVDSPLSLVLNLTGELRVEGPLGKVSTVTVYLVHGFSESGAHIHNYVNAL